jgi:hypothetical protein
MLLAHFFFVYFLSKKSGNHGEIAISPRVLQDLQPSSTSGYNSDRSL